MKKNLIEEIEQYFYSNDIKFMSDKKFKVLILKVMEMKTKESDDEDYILRKKQIIHNHLKAFFKSKDTNKRKNEICKAISIINEISEN